MKRTFIELNDVTLVLVDEDKEVHSGNAPERLVKLYILKEEGAKTFAGEDIQLRKEEVILEE